MATLNRKSYGVMRFLEFFWRNRVHKKVKRTELCLADRFSVVNTLFLRTCCSSYSYSGRYGGDFFFRNLRSDKRSLLWPSPQPGRRFQSFELSPYRSLPGRFWSVQCNIFTGRTFDAVRVPDLRFPTVNAAVVYRVSHRVLRTCYASPVLIEIIIPFWFFFFLYPTR